MTMRSWAMVQGLPESAASGALDWHGGVGMLAVSRARYWVNRAAMLRTCGTWVRGSWRAAVYQRVVPCLCTDAFTLHSKASPTNGSPTGHCPHV